VDALVKQRKLSDALTEAQKAAAESPEAAEPHRSLGLIYGLLDRLTEAEKELRAALAARATTQGYLDLGSVLGQEKRPKEALHVFKRALREEPNNPMALMGAAMAGEDAGLPDEAMEHLKKVLALPRGGVGEGDLTSIQTMAQKRLDRLRSAAPAAPTGTASAAPAAKAPAPRPQER
jgi:Flp pilus assembly protein TadD